MDEIATSVEVVYATLEVQEVVPIPFAQGMTVEMAVQRSGLLDRYPEIEALGCVVGIYGQRVELERVLAAGDRVEICRPLASDPRQMRRALLASGRVMGGADLATATKPGSR